MQVNSVRKRIDEAFNSSSVFLHQRMVIFSGPTPTYSRPYTKLMKSTLMHACNSKKTATAILFLLYCFHLSIDGSDSLWSSDFLLLNKQ